MGNPFSFNRKTLRTGFYFDNKKKCIVYYFAEDEDDDNMFSSDKVYSRYSTPGKPSLFMDIDERGKVSDLEDLVDITLDVLTDKESLKRDFEWLKNKTAVGKEFVAFLINEEKYIELEVFRIYVQSGLKPTPEVKERRGRDLRFFEDSRNPWS